MNTQTNTYTKIYTHQERSLTGRLLFFISAEVNYYHFDLEEGETTGSNNYQIRYLKISFSFDKKMFYANYGLREYVNQLEEEFAFDIIRKGQDFDPQILTDLASIIQNLPSIRRFYFPDFALTSTDRNGKLDMDSIEEKIGAKANLPFLELAIHELALYTTVDFSQAYDHPGKVLKEIKAEKFNLHPWVYFMTTEFCRLRILKVI